MSCCGPSSKIDYHKEVGKYYGESLCCTDDLKTNCCTAEAPPTYLREIFKKIPAQITDKFYGCGSPIPLGIKGRHILDLGCGTGRDCYAAAALVGASGSVTGLDMTESQLQVARDNAEAYLAQLGENRPEMKFIKALIEDPQAAGVAVGSMDVCISNCVVNLSPTKEAVLRGIYKSLKEGGEFYFSDIYSDRRLSPDARNDPTLVGECIGGALYSNDFIHLCRSVGFSDPRILKNTSVDMSKSCPGIELLKGAKFASVTVRLFKLQGLEASRESYGHTATYKGTITESPDLYEFDMGLTLEKNVPKKVDGNVARILRNGWLREHFSVEGDESNHLGRMCCAPTVEAQFAVK